MLDSSGSGSVTHTAEIPERIADFVKIHGMYPPGNRRIMASAARLLEVLEEPFASEGECRFVFEAGGIQFANERIEVVPDSKADTLRQLFDTCCLAGIALKEGLQLESLTIFADGIAEARRSKETLSFAECWPDEIPAIELIERRYDSIHSASSLESFSFLGDATPKATLTTLLRSSETILSRARSIEARIATLADTRKSADSEYIEFDLLQQIVGLLPAETMSNGVELSSTVNELLLQLEANLEEGMANGFDLEAMMSRLSRRFFTSGTRKESQQGQFVDARERGHAGDDAIHEDFEAFAAELEALPNEEIELDFESEEQIGETFSVYLYFYIRLDPDDAVRYHVRDVLLAALKSHPDIALTVSASVFESLTEGPSRRVNPRLDLMLELYAEAGLGTRLIQEGWLSVEDLTSWFPRGFSIFVDALDFADDEERARLFALLEGIGIDRIADKRGLGTELMRARCAERLLDLNDARLLPIAHTVLREDRETWREPVLEFVERLKLDWSAINVLRLLPDDEVSAEFLIGLTGRKTNGKFPRGFGLIVEKIASRALADTPSEPEYDERRIAAIRLLGEFGSMNSKPALRKLTETKKRLFKSADSRVKTEAERALELIEGRCRRV